MHFEVRKSISSISNIHFSMLFILCCYLGTTFSGPDDEPDTDDEPMRETMMKRELFDDYTADVKRRKM